MNVLARIIAFRWQPGMVIDHRDVFECLRGMSVYATYVHPYYGTNSEGIIFNPDVGTLFKDGYVEFGIDPDVPEQVIMVKKPFVSMQFATIMSDSQGPEDYATYDILEIGIEELLGEFREPLERIYDWVRTHRKGRSKNEARAFVVAWEVKFTGDQYEFDEDWYLRGLVNLDHLVIQYGGEEISDDRQV